MALASYTVSSNLFLLRLYRSTLLKHTTATHNCNTLLQNTINHILRLLAWCTTSAAISSGCGGGTARLFSGSVAVSCSVLLHCGTTCLSSSFESAVVLFSAAATRIGGSVAVRCSVLLQCVAMCCSIPSETVVCSSATLEVADTMACVCVCVCVCTCVCAVYVSHADALSEEAGGAVQCVELFCSVLQWVVGVATGTLAGACAILESAVATLRAGALKKESSLPWGLVRRAFFKAAWVVSHIWMSIPVSHVVHVNAF